MGDETQNSQFSRLKRTLILAILGIATVGTGTIAGLWLTSTTPDKDAGVHSTENDSPPNTDADEDGADEISQQMSDNELDFATEQGAWDDTASLTDRIANHVANGDNALRIGDYARAISDYRYVLEMTDGAAEASVRYRLALSSECSGAIQDALEQYQAIAQKFSQSNWNDVAQLGRVRCLALTGQAEVLSSIVYRNLILDNTALTPPVQREVLHSAARGMCRFLLRKRRTDILAPETVVLSASETNPNAELAGLSQLVQAESLPAGLPAFELLQRFDDDPDPENIYFKLHTKHASLESLLSGLTRRASLRLQLTAAARDSMKSRRQVVHADDISLSLLLDGLCVPFGLVWTSTNDVIRISLVEETPADQQSKFLLTRVNRLLNAATIEAPNSSQLAHTRIAHGCLKFETGRAADAALLFNNQLISGKTPEIDIEAAFNLGKCYQSLGQLTKAEEAWYRCVDSGGRDRATLGAAYICLGRLQLEDARFQKAATSLVRALDLTDGTPLEQHAAAMLGSAYLMTGNASTANTAMFAHRDSIEDEAVDKAVQFASALARFRVTALSERRNIEAEDVVATLAHFDPETAFGGHWYILAAQAADDLGLIEIALQHYASAVRVLQAGGLKTAAMLRLAGRYRDEQRLTDAAKLLAAARAGNSDTESLLSHEVSLQSADIAFRAGRMNEVIARSHKISTATEDESLRRRALRLMGRAFERRALEDDRSRNQKLKDHEMAVYCFAGMLPKSVEHQAIIPASHGALK